MLIVLLSPVRCMLLVRTQHAYMFETCVMLYMLNSKIPSRICGDEYLLMIAHVKVPLIKIFDLMNSRQTKWILLLQVLICCTCNFFPPKHDQNSCSELEICINLNKLDPPFTAPPLLHLQLLLPKHIQNRCSEISWISW